MTEARWRIDEVAEPDYASIIALYAASAVNRPSDWRYHASLDARRRAAGCTSRWLVIRDARDRLVAAAWFGHEIFDFRPPHPRFWLVVAAEFRRQGLGSALLTALRRIAGAAGAVTLTTTTVTPEAELRAFGAGHGASRLPGFVGLGRAIDASDIAPWTLRIEALASQRAARGVTVGTFAALRAGADFWGRYAAFNRVVSPDLPGPVPCTVPSDEALRAELEDTTRVNHAASQLAIDSASGAVVAVSSLLHGRDGRTAIVGLTAVRAEMRRTGLAEELKLRAMIAAAEAGVESLTTTCFENNVPMLSLNERLGFRQVSVDSIWRVPVL